MRSVRSYKRNTRFTGWRRGYSAATLALSLVLTAAPGSAQSGKRDGAAAPSEARQSSPPGLEVFNLKDNIHVIFSSEGGNVTVQSGPDGLLVVDAGAAATSKQTLAAMRELSAQPIRFIVNTSILPDYSGGNGALSEAGDSLVTARFDKTARQPARIVAFQAVLDRMVNQPDISSQAWPTETYALLPRKERYFNGEAVVIYHEPNAVTDGDSVVFFRRADVIATGAIFTPHRYPVIDVERGGSIDGEIAALNHLLELTVPMDKEEGGTYVVPGQGRISDEAELANYRDMVTIIRDRIRAMIADDMSLTQVKAAKPTLDYDPTYGATRGSWTTDRFVEAVYTSLRMQGTQDSSHDSLRQSLPR